MIVSKLPDLLHKRFGRLFVVDVERVNTGNRTRVSCTCWCDCGVEKSVRVDALTSGATQSCGCMGVERRSIATALRSFKHGMRWTREYASWSQMKVRCQDPNNHKFKDYGGRGIKVCASWQAFENFYRDMGPRPEGTSLDRIDVDGDYAPGNCRWADAKTQRSNRRDSKKAIA